MKILIKMRAVPSNFYALIRDYAATEIVVTTVDHLIRGAVTIQTPLPVHEVIKSLETEYDLDIQKIELTKD